VATLTRADSKTLTHAKRLALLDVLGSQPDDLKWAVRVMSPHDISRHMLQRTPYNLCVCPSASASRVGAVAPRARMLMYVG